jgi:uncharacterized protein
VAAREDLADGRQGDLTVNVAPAGRSAGEPQSVRSERIALLDALRAFALFGILQVNILSYLWGPGGLTAFAEPPSAVDRTVYLLVATLVSTKFLSLFALLFGYGFALQMKSLRRAAGGDEPEARRTYRRRLWFLLAIGVAHGTLLYFGDILTAYAVCGFVLLLYARARSSVLARHARNWLLAYAVLSLLLMLAGARIGRMLPDEAISQVPPEWLQRFEIAATGDYADYVLMSVFDYLDLTLLSLTLASPYIIGLFLLGALAARQGWLAHPARHPRVWRAARLIGWCALPAAALGAWLSLQSQIQTPGLPSSWGFTLTTLSFPLLGLYLAWIVARRDAPWMRVIVAWLAPAGRMPLTNYLTQSLAMGLLLSGWGLGLGAAMSVTALSLLALAIVAAQIVLSRAWIQRFGQGPVEALWKRATYASRSDGRDR